jgi:hypothetical protein
VWASFEDNGREEGVAPGGLGKTLAKSTVCLQLADSGADNQVFSEIFFDAL